MATVHPNDYVIHNDHSPHNPKYKETEFVSTNLFEVIMYLIAVGLVASVALILSAGLDQAASMFTQLLGAR